MSDVEAPGQGHNSGEEVPDVGLAIDRLRSIVERVERLDEETKGLKDDRKDIFSEAKSAGFDTKVLREIIRIRARKPDEVAEQEALLDTYRRALGM